MAFEGIRVLGDGSRPYLFINWFLRPISVAEIPEALETLTQEGLFHYPAYLFYFFLIFLKHYFNEMANLDIWSTTITVAAVAEAMDGRQYLLD